MVAGAGDQGAGAVGMGGAEAGDGFGDDWDEWGWCLLRRLKPHVG